MRGNFQEQFGQPGISILQEFSVLCRTGHELIGNYHLMASTIKAVFVLPEDQHPFMVHYSRDHLEHRDFRVGSDGRRKRLPSRIVERRQAY